MSDFQAGTRWHAILTIDLHWSIPASKSIFFNWVMDIFPFWRDASLKNKCGCNWLNAIDTQAARVFFPSDLTILLSVYNASGRERVIFVGMGRYLLGTRYRVRYCPQVLVLATRWQVRYSKVSTWSAFNMLLSDLVLTLNSYQTLF